ncbi:hypothetical protein BGZ94_001870 [Podila epigama]|nr:hypothetical protein BGZ94_001870 [Podila epigama]
MKSDNTLSKNPHHYATKDPSAVSSEPASHSSIAPQQQNHYNEPGGPVTNGAKQGPLDSDDDNTMDYALQDTPIHPLATAFPSSSSSTSSSHDTMITTVTTTTNATTTLNSSNASRPPVPHPHPHPHPHDDSASQTSSSPPSISPSAFPQQPQQHQQLLKLKNEHGCSPSSSPSLPNYLADANSTFKDDIDTTPMDTSSPDPSSHNEPIMASEETPRHTSRFSSSPAPPEKSQLMVDTSSDAIQHGSTASAHRARTPQMQMLSAETMGTTPTTPSTATMTPDTASAPLSSTTNSSAAASTPTSSRRGSLRAPTATLPRTALQEETVALFKKYKSLIPCAKCFNRDTIQRDGMSDGNLRFKCRPPVSMSLICNKSYSESKIRNMIAGVVYGYTLPDSGTPTSASAEKSNVLAFPPPPTTTSTTTRTYRRGSQKPAADLPLQGHLNGNTDEDSHTADKERHRQRNQRKQNDDMNGNGGSRRGSVQHPYQRPLAAAPPSGGDDSPMMDYEDATMMPPANRPNRPHTPGTPPLDNSNNGDDHGLQRSHSSYSLNGLSPATASTRNGGCPPPPPSGARQPQKLHHSRSHPNIGQQRQQQQYAEQQQHDPQSQAEHHRSYKGSTFAPHHQPYPQHPMHQQRPQVGRRESAPYSIGGGSSNSDRRFSHPATGSTLKMSSGHGHGHGSRNHMDEAHSPALSSSSRSSAGREPVLAPMGDHPQAAPGTPTLGALPHDYYAEKAASPYQRRMSQPLTSMQQQPRSGSVYSQLPGVFSSKQSSPLGGGQGGYDRRGSEVDEYHHSHREKYERLNANTLRQYKSPFLSSHPSPDSQAATRASPLLSSSSPLLSSFSSTAAPSMSRATVGGGGYTPSSAYPMSPLPQSAVRQQQQSSSLYGVPSSRRDYSDSVSRDSFGPESSLHESFLDDTEPRQFAKMRGSIKQPLGISSNNTDRSFASGGTLFSSSSSRLSNNKDLDAVLPKNTIKLTCFPAAAHRDCLRAKGQEKQGTMTPISDSQNVISRTLTSSGAEITAMQLSQSSKLVIEISQPRVLQSFRGSKSHGSVLALTAETTTTTGSGASDRGKTLRHAISQPNLLQRSSSSILGYRRSASPDDRMDFGSSKKRRADSVSGGGRDEDHSIAVKLGSGSISTPSVSGSSASAATAAATAAAVAAAASAAAAAAASLGQSATLSPHLGGGRGGNSGAAQLDYMNKEKGLGLGLTNVADDIGSPTIEALDVACAPSTSPSSFVVLEDQKELGIDYSHFTRVETASWRILIPPNVTASFKSEDFGLLLKPRLGRVGDREELEDEEDEEEEEGRLKTVRKTATMDENGVEEEDEEAAASDAMTADSNSEHEDNKEVVALPTRLSVMGISNDSSKVEASDEEKGDSTMANIEIVVESCAVAQKVSTKDGAGPLKGTAAAAIASAATGRAGEMDIEQECDELDDE